jgi:hypothetical protein
MDTIVESPIVVTIQIALPLAEKVGDDRVKIAGQNP